MLFSQRFRQMVLQHGTVRTWQLLQREGMEVREFQFWCRTLTL